LVYEGKNTTVGILSQRVFYRYLWLEKGNIYMININYDFSRSKYQFCLRQDVIFCTYVHVTVCLSVSTITKKILNVLMRKLAGQMDIAHGQIFVKFRWKLDEKLSCFVRQSNA
jgi:hypothetical protein